jgi:adenylate cyclase
VSDDDLDVVAAALRAAGVDDDALAAAANLGPDALVELVTRHLIVPGARRYTPAEVWEAVGATEQEASALWRAMGFPLVPDDERAFTDADVEALGVALGLFERAGMGRAVVLQQARTMSQAAARIAAAHQDVIADVALGAADDPMGAAVDAVALARDALPALDHLLVYMYRRHLLAAAEQRMRLRSDEPGAARSTVGFADLVGFTARSQEVDAQELADLVDRFNGTAADVVTDGGGRVVKTIGDEVMFTTDDPAAGAAIALELVDAISSATGHTPLRAGVGTGPVVAREGDVFGPTVNLASRLVGAARPSTVLVDRDTADLLGDDDRFTLSPAPAMRLKGLGSIRPYRLRRAGISGDEGSPRARR